MTTAILTATDTVQLNARSVIAAALSQALTDPRHRRRRLTPQQADLLRAAWTLIRDASPDADAGDWGLGELPVDQADIEPVIQWLSLPAQVAEDAHVAVYGLTTPRNCPPYETEYLHWTDPTYRSHQMADIAAFYRAFGLDIAASRHDRHDHIALQIEFVSFLVRKLALKLETDAPHDDAETVCDDALSAFLRDHLIWWAPTFARSLESQASKATAATNDEAIRDAIAALIGTTRTLRAWLAAERRWAGVEPCRRIIAPMVEPPIAEEESGACGECDSQDCHASVFDAAAPVAPAPQ